jgi:DNA repair protein RadC
VGLAGLSDAELIALVVRSGGAGKSALHLAAELLAEGGTLERLSRALPEELGRIGSVGAAKAASLAAAFELGRRAAAPAELAAVVKTPEDIVRTALPYVSQPRQEEAFVVVLNASNRVLKVQRLTVGASDHALLPARDVIVTVLRYEGVAFALVHTHPSGDTTPSAPDVQATATVAQAAQATGVRFLDHVIVAGTKWASCRD